MTDNENALIAYAILDEVNELVTYGGDPTVITREIARAQVYATLAAVPAPPSQDALQDVIYDTLRARDADVGLLDAGAVAEAVGRLL